MPKSNPVTRKPKSPKNSARFSGPTDLRLANILNELIQRFEAEQQENLLQAASLMADACEDDRLI